MEISKVTHGGLATDQCRRIYCLVPDKMALDTLSGEFFGSLQRPNRLKCIPFSEFKPWLLWVIHVPVGDYIFAQSFGQF